MSKLSQKRLRLKGKWWVDENCLCSFCLHSSKLQMWAEKDETVPGPECPQCGNQMQWDMGTISRTGKREKSGTWVWVPESVMRVRNERPEP